MAYEFQETLEVFIPNFEEQLSSFQEGSDFSNNHGLITEIASIHAGVTSNFNEYGADSLENSLIRWTSPYPKPIIMNHDPHSEPVGRVIGAKMDKEDDGTPFIRLQAAILDPAAVQKVADGRYLTGSVGGRANEAVCSICNTDWAKPRESAGMPCKHQRGKVYSGKVMTMQMRDVDWKEYSFVNMPADANSAIRTKNKEADTSDEWVKAARFFVLDMEETNIVEYTESEDRNVLEGMRKKDSLPLYMGLKGAFLSAVAINEEEENVLENGVNTRKDNTNEFDSSNSEENHMATQENTPSQEDDILAIVEDLQEDTPATEEEAPTPAEDEVTENKDDSPQEDGAVEDGEDKAEEQADERAQGQEKPHARDVDSETSDGAPKSREDEDENSEDEAVAEDKEIKSEDEKAPLAEDTHEDAELDSPKEDEIESHEEDELKVRVTQLEEENSRLKKALHRTLAERAVEAKITAGILNEEDRVTAINEHATRTASSLADSIRDLATVSGKTERKPIPTQNDLKINETSEVVGEEEHVTTIGEEDTSVEEKVTPEKQLEDLLVQALTGKIKL